MILTNNLKIRGVEIIPFNGDPKDQVSVDLTVGALYQRSGDPDWLHVNEALTIHPGTCFIIQTAESIKMPNNNTGVRSCLLPLRDGFPSEWQNLIPLTSRPH